MARKWTEPPSPPPPSPLATEQTDLPPPEAPERRSPVGETLPRPPTPEARPAEPKPDKNLKEHELKPAEIAPVHKMLGRILGKISTAPTEDELSALNEFGARFWSRWIKTNWGASALAYGGAVGEVAAVRVVDFLMKPRSVTMPRPTPEVPVRPPDPPAPSNGKTDAKIDTSDMVDVGAGRA